MAEGGAEVRAWGAGRRVRGVGHGTRGAGRGLRGMGHIERSEWHGLRGEGAWDEGLQGAGRQPAGGFETGAGGLLFNRDGRLAQRSLSS